MNLSMMKIRNIFIFCKINDLSDPDHDEAEGVAACMMFRAKGCIFKNDDILKEYDKTGLLGILALLVVVSA